MQTKLTVDLIYPQGEIPDNASLIEQGFDAEITGFAQETGFTSPKQEKEPPPEGALGGAVAIQWVMDQAVNNPELTQATVTLLVFALREIINQYTPGRDPGPVTAVIQVNGITINVTGPAEEVRETIKSVIGGGDERQ